MYGILQINSLIFNVTGTFIVFAMCVYEKCGADTDRL